jgi:hypothetical protein
VLILNPLNENKIEIENGREKQELYKKFYVIQELTHDLGGFCGKKISEHMMEPFKDDEKFMKIFSHHNKRDENPSYTFLDNCEYKNCFFTCNTQYLDVSDAYLFHSDYIRDIMKYTYIILRFKRKSRQVWVFWNYENTLQLTNKIDYFKFNWTLGSSRDSEIRANTFGRMTERKKNISFNAMEGTIWEFKNRSNAATWFINDCPTKSILKFANEFSNYFPIKVGGTCMKSISGSKVIYLEENILYGRSSPCERDYMKKNKFHIAFEANNCTDYVTEKFWHSLSLGMIPVVFQPPKEAYKRLVPEDSFIHAQDFNYNPKLLAQYLDRVSNEKELYLKHLNWKFIFKLHYVGDFTDTNDIKLCQLCTKLNQETKSIYYKSIASWYYHKCNDSSFF